MKQMIAVVAKKELKRIFTDRRLVVALFVLPFVSILMMYSLIAWVTASFVDDVRQHESTVVLINAPKSIEAFINERSDLNMSVTFLKEGVIETYREDLKQGKLDLLVQFPEGFERSVEAYKTMEVPRLKVYHNYGEDYSVEALNSFVDKVMGPYKEKTLISRFGDLSYLEIYEVLDLSETAGVVDKEKAAGKNLSSVFPMLVSIFLFAGAMSVVLESVAGEKERGTLATLLITPVKREAIVIGKMLSLSVVSILSALSSLLGMVLTFLTVYLIFPEGLKGLSSSFEIHYGVMDFLLLGYFMILMVSLYVGILVLLSSYSKSMKEAGTLVTPVYLVVMVLSFLNMFSFDVAPLWKYLIPVYGSILGIKEVFMFQVTGMKLLVALLSTGLTLVGLTLWIKALFNNEKMLFTE